VNGTGPPRAGGGHQARYARPVQGRGRRGFNSAPARCLVRSVP